MKKFWYLKFISGTTMCAILIASCGSGSHITSDAGMGNAISGSLQIDNGSSGLTQAKLSPAKRSRSYSAAKILLVSWIGNIIDVFVTDESGNFSFSGLTRGDYIIRIVDVETAGIVTEAKLSLVNGDNATITGVITPSAASWIINFKANDSVLLQNESQQVNARDLSDASEKNFDEVISLRTNGMGWGEIAELLGVTTGTLGFRYEEGFDSRQSTEVSSENIGSSNKPS